MRRPSTTHPRMRGTSAGLTIIEVLVSFALITLFFFGVIQVMYRSQMATAQAAYLQTASSLMTYVAREITQGGGGTASYLYSTGPSTINTPGCNNVLSGITTSNARSLPAAMVAQAMGRLGLSGRGYNDPSLYSAAVTVTPTTRTVGTVTYQRATYEISVFFPGTTTRNCLSSTVEAHYQ